MTTKVCILLPTHELTFYIERFTKNYYISEPAIVRIKSKPADGIVSLFCTMDFLTAIIYQALNHVFKLKKSVEENVSEGEVATKMISYSVLNGTTLKYNCCK